MSLSTLWDVYRDGDGKPVTVPCDYGYVPDGYRLTLEQIRAVRHAVAVWRDVCAAAGSQQADPTYRTSEPWKHPNMAKSRLLGRMIHHGLPPHDLPPPKSYAGGWWRLVEDGHALLSQWEVGAGPYSRDGCWRVNIAHDEWQVVHETHWSYVPQQQLPSAPTVVLPLYVLHRPCGRGFLTSEQWTLRGATYPEIMRWSAASTVADKVRWAPWWWLERKGR